MPFLLLDVLTTKKACVSFCANLTNNFLAKKWTKSSIISDPIVGVAYEQLGNVIERILNKIFFQRFDPHDYNVI